MNDKEVDDLLQLLLKSRGTGNSKFLGEAAKGTDVRIISNNNIQSGFLKKCNNLRDDQVANKHNIESLRGYPARPVVIDNCLQLEILEDLQKARQNISSLKRELSILKDRESAIKAILGVKDTFITI